MIPLIAPHRTVPPFLRYGTVHSTVPPTGARRYGTVLRNVPATVTFIQRGMPSKRIPVQPGAAFGLTVRGGVPFSLLGMSTGAPAAAIALLDIYAPYTDSITPQSFTLGMQTATHIHLHFKTADGLPATAVSACALLLTNAREQAILQQSGLMSSVQAQADGSIDFLTPISGSYFAAPDLFAVAPASEMRFSAVPGDNDITLTLPKPLLTVPAGAAVYYLPKTLSTGAQVLRAAALPTAMPIYGREDVLAALWYRKDNEHLVYWCPAKGAPVTLSRREVTVTLLDANGQPLTGAVRILPLFPSTPDSAGLPPLAPESAATTVPDTRTKIALWPGRYTVERLPGAIAGVLEVPADGNTALTVRLSPDAM